jgi:SAM-dependent methyltransferase
LLKSLRTLLNKLLFFIPPYLIGIICFEIVSFLGRLFSRPLTLKPGKNYINLGSGPNIVTNCINVDFFTTSRIDYGADLRYPLRIPDKSIDGIFCEHTLEHLTYAQNDKLLSECHRILKPGAFIRIILPDISVFIKNYQENNDAWFKMWEKLMFTNSPSPERRQRVLQSNLQALSFVTQEYGHISAWDVKTLSRYLAKNNFMEIKACSFRQGGDPQLLIDLDEEDRKFVSLYVEAISAV